MNKVYLIVNCEGYANSYVSWEEVKEEFEETIWQDPYCATDNYSIVVADVEETTVAELDPNVEAVFVYYGYGESVVFWPDDYPNFEAFKADLAREDHSCMVEEIGFDVNALYDLKRYMGKFTVAIEEV